MNAPHHGRRRRRTVAAAAVTAVGALVLAGCGQADDTPVLTWYTNPDDGGQATIAQQCTEEAGGRYRIETSVLPNSASDQREQLTRRLAAGDSSMDIMSLDPPFVPELVEPGFLAPVPQELQDTVSQGTLEGALQGATWNDELVAVPFWANTQLLWYRKSVAEAAGLDMTQPVTWEQIIKAAQDQEKLLGVQGIKAESMSVWLNALMESAGQPIVEDPQAPAEEFQTNFDTEGGRAAAEVISTIGKEGLGGPGLPTQDENASMLLFRGDNGSFMVNWPFVWAATQAAVDEGSVDQEVLDDIGWTTYPRMSPDQESAPPLGGINLGVGNASEHQDLAWDAVKCIVTPEHQADYFVTNGNPPAHEDAYNDPRIKDAYPMADVIRQSLDQAAPRPQTPFYNDLSLGIQEEFTPPSAVDPETTPAEADDFIGRVMRGESLL